MEGLEDIREEHVETPSVPHRHPTLSVVLEAWNCVPSTARARPYRTPEVPYRANVFGMKKLGELIISVSAVGSLQEEVVPGHVVSSTSSSINQEPAST